MTLAPQPICMGLIYRLREWGVSICQDHKPGYYGAVSKAYNELSRTHYIQSAWMCGMLPCVVQSQIFYLIRRVREHVIASLCSHKQSTSEHKSNDLHLIFRCFFFFFFHSDIKCVTQIISSKQRNKHSITKQIIHRQVRASR